MSANPGWQEALHKINSAVDTAIGALTTHPGVLLRMQDSDCYYPYVILIRDIKRDAQLGNGSHGVVRQGEIDLESVLGLPYVSLPHIFPLF